LILDTEQKGLGNGIGSAEMLFWYNAYALKNGLETRSRASIINSMNSLEEQGFLDSYEVTGKGGYSKRYYPAMSPQQFSLKVVELFTDKVREVFANPLEWWTTDD
jgi:predicted transcriptional regulator